MVTLSHSKATRAYLQNGTEDGFLYSRNNNGAQNINCSYASMNIAAAMKLIERKKTLRQGKGFSHAI